MAAHESPRCHFLTHSAPSKLANWYRIHPAPREYGESQLVEPWVVLVDVEVLASPNWIHLGCTKVVTDWSRRYNHHCLAHPSSVASTQVTHHPNSALHHPEHFLAIPRNSEMTPSRNHYRFLEGTGQTFAPCKRYQHHQICLHQYFSWRQASRPDSKTVSIGFAWQHWSAPSLAATYCDRNTADHSARHLALRRPDSTE